MEFFNSAIDTLQTLVIAIGAGLGVWGIINLLEGYGNDNPGAKAHVNYTNSYRVCPMLDMAWVTSLALSLLSVA